MLAAQNPVEAIFAWLDVGPHEPIPVGPQKGVCLTESYLKCPSASYDKAVQERVADCSKAIPDGILYLQHIRHPLEPSHLPCQEAKHPSMDPCATHMAASCEGWATWPLNSMRASAAGLETGCGNMVGLDLC